ncbi:MAG: TetR/AcrR family transcriptional regulator [Candidatus Cloacimonetes bacterium]|nr:TetR/AcrR family transcriptional regulator [Candidatus Cloacimonadota bacterium]
MFSKRQQQIIETAIKLIAEKGIQNLTIKNISKEIGITEPALYRHFDNKLEILKGIIQYFSIIMKPAFESMQKENQPIQQIENFFFSHLRILNNNYNFAKVIFSESNFQNDETLINSINIMMNKSQQKIKSVILQGQAINEIHSEQNALNISRIIIGSLRFLVIQWTMSGMVFDLEGEGLQLWNDIKKLIVNTN